MEEHPLTTLRRKIRQTGHQFRQQSDNSKSLFSPTNGFIYAYQIHMVETALDDYESSLEAKNRPEPTQEPVTAAKSLEDQIASMASRIVNTHDSMEARDFARTVLAYMAFNKPAEKSNPLRLLFGKGYDDDTLE